MPWLRSTTMLQIKVFSHEHCWPLYVAIFSASEKLSESGKTTTCLRGIPGQILVCRLVLVCRGGLQWQDIRRVDGAGAAAGAVGRGAHLQGAPGHCRGRHAHRPARGRARTAPAPRPGRRGRGRCGGGGRQHRGCQTPCQPGECLAVYKSGSPK